MLNIRNIFTIINKKSLNIISFLLFFILILVFSLSYFSNKIVSELTYSAIEITYKEGSEIIDIKLSTYINTVKALSSSSGFKSSSYKAEDKIPAIISYISLSDSKNLGVISSLGEIYLINGKKYNLSDNSELSELVETKKDFIKVLHDEKDSSYYIAIGSPIIRDDSSVEYIIDFLPMENLFSPIQSLNKNNNDSLLLIDENYNVLSSKTKEKTAIQITNYIQKKDKKTLAISKNNNLTLSLYDGYVGIKYLEDINLFLVVYSPADTILQLTSKTLLMLFSFIIIFFLAIISLIFYYNKLKISFNKTKGSNDNVVNVTNLMIISFDRTGSIKSINEFIEKKLHYSKDYLLDNCNIQQITHSSCYNVLDSLLKVTDTTNKSFNYELTFLDLNNNKLYANFTVSDISNTFYSYENVIEIIGIDITDRVLANKELQNKHNELKEVYHKLEISKEQLEIQYKELEKSKALLSKTAYYDAITGLATRNKLNLIFENHLKENPKESFHLLFMDLDNFKFINDSIGHNMGDLFLKEVASILNSTLKSNFNLARCGGDEFILLIWTSNEELVAKTASSIIEAFKKPIKLDKYLMNTGISIGIAKYPEHGKTLNDVIKYADKAMYNAKMLGKSRFVFFDDKTKLDLDSTIEIQNNLKTAIINKEFELYYQPKYCVKSNKIIGLEALIRWNSPTLGLISPNKFIHIAERSNIIIDIGNWVIEEAFSFLRTLNLKENCNFNLAINLSAIQIIQEDFIDNIIRASKKYNIYPKFIEFEITETVLLTSHKDTIRKITILKEYGFRIALDDFGTGYSSLSYLSDLPIDTLKIDKSFVNSLESSDEKFFILDSIISLSKKLNYSIVAEGVENKIQLNILKQMNCDTIQGYVFSPPVNSDTITSMLS